MKVTLKMFLHWSHTDYSGPQWQLWSTDMSAHFKDTVCIGEREIEIDAPDDFDPRPGMVDSLRKQKAQVLADAQLKATQIEGRIQQLLCIEHKPEVTA